MLSQRPNHASVVSSQDRSQTCVRGARYKQGQLEQNAEQEMTNNSKNSCPLIVTGADEAYFPLVLELILSIRNHDEGSVLPIGVIDAGLTDSQKEILSTHNCIIRKFDNGTPLIKKAIVSRKALTVNLGKLWLDVIFPEYDLFVFLDADSWVQNWSSIDLLIGAASENCLAIVDSWHRYRDTLPIRWYMGLIPVFRSFNTKAAFHAGLPLSILKKISRYPDLNAGVYALKRDVAHWERMRYWQNIILKKGRPFTSDGLAMALACCVDELSLQRMPEVCNYTALPLYDEHEKLFLDPYYPHAPIGVIHLAGQKQIRFDTNATLTFLSLTGKSYSLNPRYDSKKFNVI